MNKNTIWIIVLILIATPTLAQLIYEQDLPIDLKVPCMNNGTYCSSSALCNVTILYPNSTALVNNKVMTNNLAFHNYSLTATQTNTLGEHEVIVMCQDGTEYGYSTLNYKITPTGEEPSTPEGILYIGIFAVILIFLILCIYGITKVEKLLVRFGLFHVAYLLMIAITFIAWNISDRFIINAPFLVSFTEILFRVLIIAYIPFILSSFIWLFYMTITIKEITKMMDSGVPEDEAWARKKGKKW